MKLLTLAATLTAALCAAGTAAGTPPDVSTQEFGFTGVDTFTCGFPLQTTLSVELTTRTYYDADGAVMRIVTHTRAEGTYAGPTGLAARYDQEMNSVLDPAAGTQEVTGTTVRVTAPGAGVLLHDVGRLVFQTGFPPLVLFESGKHPVFEPGAWDGVCAYLAG